MFRTLNALLMISRVEAGSVAAEMTGVDLSSIVADTSELYEPVAEEVGLALTADIESNVEVQGNRELIGQALFNLIDNALKYAAGCQGEPKVTLKLSHTHDAVMLAVADHGPGIPAHQRADVVKRFFRLDESRSKPGTGLGLALVEAVMELHGGRLGLSDTDPDNVEAKGLTVTMIFPMQKQ